MMSLMTKSQTRSPNKYPINKVAKLFKYWGLGVFSDFGFGV
jgi:hypothetical protein